MPLQKSFSEQTKQSRRAQWQKSKSNPGIAQPSRAAKTHTPISAVTKSKLQTFQFQPPRVQADVEPAALAQQSKSHRVPDGVEVFAINEDSDKENATAPAVPAVSAIKQPSPPVPTVSFNASITTPIARLAWQDLMGGGDIAKEEDEASPSERLLWHNDRDSLTAAISPMLTRKGKKRARSSSPTSSPAVPKPTTPAVDVEELRQPIKSPYADPAMEMWDRFALSGVKNNTPIGIRNPALAQLMASSSPRPTKDKPASQGEGNLRRAISCGAQWPKRRRTDVVSPLSRLQQGVGASKASMVTALLETVACEVSRSDALQSRRQLSKSPSPLKRPGRNQTSESPSRRGAAQKSLIECGPGVVETEVLQKAVSQVSVSDYGDDEFDEDTLMELDATLLPQELPEVNPIPHQRSDDNARQATEQAVPAYEDEFGDLSSDIFVEAADLLAGISPEQKSQTAGYGAQPALVQGPDGGACSGPADAEDCYGDDFGDNFGDDFDFEAAELAATQSAQCSAASSSLATDSSQKPKAIQRYLVTNVLESSYADDRGREFPEKILLVQAERTSAIKSVHLRGEWLDTPVNANAYTHIIGLFEATGRCIIDNTQNMVILHPDQLISSTVVADSFSCMRRAVLQDRVKATSDSTPALVYGTLLHEIFQEALLANRWDPAFLSATVDKTMANHVEDLYVIKVPANAAREDLLAKLKELPHWARAFVSATPKREALVQGRNGEKVNMCVSKLLDVEEHVWSPMYGLKGNIDATVQVTMRDGSDSRTLTVPFELKTGRNASSNHQAQTALYNLLLSDRYDIDIVYGILYYMESSQTLRIPAIRHELRHMIMQRNQLACYIRERSVQLPPMKRDKNACGKCYAQASCFTYHKLADDGDGQTSGMGAKFDDLTKHLSPKHRDFFLKWEDLLTKEEKESQKHKRELWTMISSEREKLGRCFGNVVIEEGSTSEDKITQKINRFHYSFVKETATPGFSFLDSQLRVGEPVVVSDEQGHFALACGYVSSVHRKRIGVSVDRRLHNARIKQAGFDAVNNQVFASIMEVGTQGTPPQQLTPGRSQELPTRYRLDKDEFSNGMSLVRNNLVQVMADGPYGSREIRRLVVDLQPPAFKTVATQYTIADKESLNVDQKKAIDKVMSARDYALVLGMPGTGKTTTIAHIIRALICQKKSVLLTSYTHTAVDNILLKLKADKMAILRLGARAKIHPEVREFAVLAGETRHSFEEMHSAWHDTPVVATTCLGISHAIFGERTFDYCIVDEASQITLPICLGPIRMARTFVLVGDHNQLPPLVQNDEAARGGLDVSLFKLLSDAHPASVVNLEHQYRMAEDIMTLSNTLIYGGRLKCGTESLRTRMLVAPHPQALRRHHYDAASLQRACSATTCASSPAPPPRDVCTGPGPGPGACWLADLLAPATRVAFVNTDALPHAREEAKGNRIVNPAEARLVAQLIDALLTVGVPAGEIGVMTHYNAQLSLLKHLIHGARSSSSTLHPNTYPSTSTSPSHAAVEMHTADRFQGRDKEVIVLSLVRSNDACAIGDLLRDWRRINVAFTRAKTKLLVVGSKATLAGAGDAEMLSRFVRLMEERGWVYDLPAGALESHVFDEGAVGAQVGPAPVRAKRSPKKGGGAGAGRRGVGGGKENVSLSQREPKRAKVGEKVLLKGKPILRDVLNDLMGGGY